MDDVVRQVLETQHGLKLIRRIGRGGFAEVWQAQTAEEVPCAVKVSLDPLDGQNPAIPKELENLQLLKTLVGHPHVVSLTDVWQIVGYLVTRWEFSSEGSLEQRLLQYQAQGKPGIPVEELLRYIYDAAQGIDFLNGQGIVHRDIKPSNLLLFFNRVKVADLGLAKFVGASSASHTGAGTWGYLPPEAYRGRLTPTVDLYSLAATYIKLRTGKEPFGLDPPEIFRRQEAGQPTLEGMSRAEIEVVLQALAPQPEHRPQQGTRAWVEQLKAALEGKAVHSLASPILPSPPQPVPKTASPQAPLPPARDPQVVRVELDGTGDAASLEEALRLVQPGGTIRLGPGVYRLSGPLELPDGLRLVGAGSDKTHLLGTGEGFVLRLAGTGKYELQRIHVEYVGGQCANVVEVRAQDVLIVDCRFTGGKRDRQTQRGGCGLWIGGLSKAIVQNCIAEHNALTGIHVSELAQPTLTNNLCRNNQNCGIGYFGKSGGLARGNTCEGNTVCGIWVGEQAQPALENNLCRNNKASGIGYGGTSGGVARSNTCEENAVSGIWVGEQGQPTLENNLCRNNQDCGIAYFGKSGGLARGNTCEGNKYVDIYVKEEAHPRLNENVGNVHDEHQNFGLDDLAWIIGIIAVLYWWIKSCK